MIRNKEIRWLVILYSVIAAAGISFSFFMNLAAGLITLLTTLALGFCFLYFTLWRYKEIEKLSEYLTGVYTGMQTLDIRDNAEGELSILKNNIYKVTLTLYEQSELLKKDKKYLANALSDISHQLKTPLTSMFVMIDLLGSSDLPQEKRVEFLGKISQQLERIQWLVSSLLKLSKIDAGTVEFKKEPIQVSSLIDQSLAPLLIPIELKEQQLHISCPDSVYLTGDFNWTAEALLNVLKNCVEHTPAQGKLEITCSENPLHTEITISDNGNGITKEDIPFIFNRFYKGKNSGDESVGIGLAMTKTILQSQNADISVKSETGSGTRFTIKFYKRVV